MSQAMENSANFSPESLADSQPRPTRRGRRSLAELRAVRGLSGNNRFFKTPSEKAAANSLGARVRLARKRLGLSQQELAGPEYVASYISAIERDKIHPSLKALQLIATRLNEPVEYFLYGGYGSGALAEAETVGTPTNFVPETSLATALRDELLEAQVLVERASEVLDALDKEDLTKAAQILNKIPRHQLSEYDRAQLLFLFGKLYLKENNYDAARTELEEALPLANKTEQPLLGVEIRNLLGNLYYLRRQVDQALPYHRTCWEAIQADPDVFDVGLKIRVLTSLANDFLVLGRQDEAIATFQDALRMEEENNQPKTRAGIYWGLRAAYRERQDLIRARMYGMLAMNLYEELNQRHKLLRLSADMGGLLAEMGRETEAEKVLTKAVMVGQDDNSLTGTDLALTYTSLAWLRVRQGRLDEAQELSGKAIQEARSVKDKVAEGKALKLAAEVATLLDRREEARQYYQNAIELLETINLPYLLSDVYKAFSEALEKWGELDQAVVYLKKAYESKR